jgi:2-polyprenyl-3-methyl-5-hydroxy-6-metoxy-1,4-benzoquinol methylase
LDLKAESRPTLEYTGERMVPEAADSFTFWEHVYRYAFACRFAAGKRVLDIACGEGYGAEALRQAGAASVIGVDISEQACIHAREKYGIDARVGSADQIPLADASVDLVVSFETVEHVPDPRRFLGECARVLAAGGTLIVSTPNKDVYSGPGTTPNPFHCSEMTEREFLAALAGNFRKVRLYTQRARSAGWWSPRALAVEARIGAGGLERLRRSAQVRLFPRAVYDPTEEERRHVVQQILTASRASTHPLNIYAVRRRFGWTREKPRYFVAVAVARTCLQ